MKIFDHLYECNSRGNITSGHLYEHDARCPLP